LGRAWRRPSTPYTNDIRPDRHVASRQSPVAGRLPGWGTRSKLRRLGPPGTAHLAHRVRTARPPVSPVWLPTLCALDITDRWL